MMEVAAKFTIPLLFFCAFLLTVLFLRLLIPVLRAHKMGQRILQIGPSWHAGKSGTPTMGGLAFIGAVLCTAVGFSCYLFFSDQHAQMRPIAILLVYGVLCGAIGFIDDYCKFIKKQNQGLSAWQKFALQLCAAGIFLYVLRVCGMVQTCIYLPFSEKTLELGITYFPFALIFLVGIDNALNLTDGVDGLLGGTVAVVAAFFLVWGYADGQVMLVFCGAALLGGMLGFLLFNAHPAAVFMGDTGALFLGGIVGGVGVMTMHPLLLLLCGGMFVFETVSVILQVVWFRASGGKRLFLMTPFHHHLEKRGWAENHIVALFAALTMMLSFAAFFGR